MTPRLYEAINRAAGGSGTGAPGLKTLDAARPGDVHKLLAISGVALSQVTNKREYLRINVVRALSVTPAVGDMDGGCGDGSNDEEAGAAHAPPRPAPPRTAPHRTASASGLLPTITAVKKRGSIDW